MRWTWQLLLASGFLLNIGCRTNPVIIPVGHLPNESQPIDAAMTSQLMQTSFAEPSSNSNEAPKSKYLELPKALTGGKIEAIKPPRFDPNSSQSEREKQIQAAYPALPTVPNSQIPASSSNQLSLIACQETALASSPVIRKAQADADVAYGLTIQAGLHPNPTVGWQADQWQPKGGSVVPSNAGQQGGFINQLIKTFGKLQLSQTVAGFDYLNALIAVRKAKVDVMARVRVAFFQVLVMQESVRIHQALVTMTDEVYQLQLKQLLAGEAAGYEPLQLYAQAVQMRTLLNQAEASYLAAWRQLAAAMADPEAAPVRVEGKIDTEVPKYTHDKLANRIREQQTELLSARNSITQATVNLRLQQRLPYPDLQTNTVIQHDSVSKNDQFNLQLGVSLPLFDRNQGNIRAAQAQIIRANEDLQAKQNELLGQVGEAFGRYETHRVSTENYRDRILPNLTQAYQALIRRYQFEEKISFNDIVVAQQNLAQAYETYLMSLENQWKAIIDLANIAQIDDLYQP
jgi:outer membrane protein, heavy metal efflux system